VAFTALAEASRAIERDLLASVPQQAAPLEQLSYAAALLLSVAEEDFELARFVLCGDHASYLGARAAEADSLPGVLGGLVAAAAARGQCKAAPVDLLAGLWFGVVRAAVSARVSGRLGEPLTELADTVATAAVDAIRAQD
jgi:hypothetical protein